MLTQYMKNQNRNYFVKSIFLFVALLMFGCSKEEAVTPAVAELSILGKWDILVSRSTENSKTVYEYVGKTGDYVEFTNTDIILNFGGSKSDPRYQILEKNKKIKILDSKSGGGDDIYEIRNLTSKSMTLYQEYVENKITYVNYIDLKK